MQLEVNSISYKLGLKGELLKVLCALNIDLSLTLIAISVRNSFLSLARERN